MMQRNQVQFFTLHLSRLCFVLLFIIQILAISLSNSTVSNISNTPSIAPQEHFDPADKTKLLNQPVHDGISTSEILSKPQAGPQTVRIRQVNSAIEPQHSDEKTQEGIIAQNQKNIRQTFSQKLGEITGNYTTRGPIIIDGNANFTAIAIANTWTGSGTSLDPYIIADYNITGTGIEYLIDIRNTDVYFHINHSLLQGGDRGLYFENVTHGKVSQSDAVNNSFAGFFLYNSSNNILMGNTALNSARGFRLENFSSNNTLINNIALNNTNYGYLLFTSSNNNMLTSNKALNNTNFGFWLYNSSNNTFDSNTASDHGAEGFRLDVNSNNNTLIDNTASNNTNFGFYLLSSSHNNTLTGNTASNNSIDGFRLYISSYNNTLTGNTASNNTCAGFLLWNSTNNLLIDNTASNNTNFGFWLYNSSNNNMLIQNTASNNSIDGFRLYGFSNNNTLTGNAASNNTNHGFLLISSSNNNTLMDNTASNNSIDGFRLVDLSNNNTLTGNTALNNTQEGFLLWNSSNNILTGNTASSNTRRGFNLFSFSNNNALVDNTASNNTLEGVLLWTSSNNTLMDNTASNNTQEGFELIISSNNNVIRQNQIIKNNGGANQAYDDGSNNIFQFNYWSDWTSPDTNYDWIVDVPYAISGLASNQDNFPLVIYVRKHASISINGNADFASQASTESWAGDGSSGNPYVITGYNITGTGTENLVDIRNTNLYFQFANSLLFNGSRGVNLVSVTNANFLNNLVLNNTYGFYLDGGLSKTFINNIASNNTQHGFFIDSSGLTTLIDNIASFNNGDGFSWAGFFGSDILTNNTASFNGGNGFYLDGTANTLSNNTASFNSGNGFHLFLSDGNTLTNNTASNNQRGFHLHFSSTNTFTNNTASNNTQYGFYSFATADNTLTANTASFNNQHGFYLDGDSDNTFTNNTASFNSGNGFYLDGGDNNNLTSNIVSNNNLYAFNLDSTSDNNVIDQNNIINNNGGGIQALDNGSSNVFQFNHWDDLFSPDVDGNNIVDQPYVISGTVSNQDNYPLVVYQIAPIITLITPTNNTVQLSGTMIQVNITDMNPNTLQQVKYNWDGTANTTIALSNASFVFTTPLPIGNSQHVLKVYAQDSRGNWQYLQFVFTTDDLAPNITITSPTNTTYGAISVTLTYSVNEPSTVTIYLDGVANSSIMNSGFLLTNLAEGSHNLTIVAVDGVGNTGTTTVLFTVDTTFPVITVSNPTNTSYSVNEVTLSYGVTNAVTVTIYLDGVANSTAIPNGHVFTNLNEGSHNITIHVVSAAASEATTQILFTVDTIAPVITPPSDFSFVAGSTGNNLSVSASDLHPATYVLYQNGSQIDSGSWTSAEAVVVNLDTLPTGVYNFTLLVSDLAGNTDTATVIIMVTAPPVGTTTPPTNTTSSTSQGGFTTSSAPGFEALFVLITIVGLGMVSITRQRK